MKHILFVCTGNSCRSVMAEGLFRKRVEDRLDDFSVSSAGVGAIEGMSATPETIQAMSEEGVDVSEHRSQRLTPERVREADEIFVMERIHRDWVLRLVPEAGAKVHLLTEYASPDNRAQDIDIPDPIRMSGHFYKNVLSVIRDCVENIADEL